jgi:murein L,D-transpeptidase YcbB/YkuD
VSAIWTPRAPSGRGGPIVESTAVWCSISALSSAPKRTMTADSHGCVRVDDAVGYARGLSSAAGLHSEFDAKLAKGSTAVLGLKTPMPVRLMYQTAFVDRSGEIAFRPDIYGWDERLATALGMPAPMKRETRASDVDGGP